MRIPSNTITIASLHPTVREEATTLIEQLEAKLPATIAIFLNFGFRSIDQQNKLYNQGRTTPGPIVTNAKGGFSFHNYGLAFDFCWAYLNPKTNKYEVSDKTAWAVGPLHKQVTDLFISKGWEWGGDWTHIKDFPHLEKRFGYPEDCKALYQKYVNKDFISNTPYLNL